MSSTNDPERAGRVQERRRGHARSARADVLSLAVVIALFGFALGWIGNGLLWINHQPAPVVNEWDGTLPGCRTEDGL